jgi:hypothetical protein
MTRLTASIAKENESCCRPGDITVTPVPSGFMIGRALAETSGPGPWWEYIKLTTSYEEAVAMSRELAAETRTRAWFHLHGENYDLIS